MSGEPPGATILGVSALYHDSAAALVRGSEILAAAQEERFSRSKHDPRFPTSAVAYCTAVAGGPGAFDAVAFYEDPVLSLDRVLKSTIEIGSAAETLWPVAAASQFGRKINIVGDLTRTLGPVAADNVFFVEHHLSHAASAFYPSPFREAAIVTMDGVGEWASTTIARGDGSGIEALMETRFPHSLGLLFSAFTYHCGFRVNSGEFKLMGLAPYGKPRHVRKILDHLLDLRDDGSFRLNTKYFGHLTSTLATNEAFEELFECPRRSPDDRITVDYMDIAASAQSVIEEAMRRICCHALAVTESRNLCLAGGVALNCVAAGRLLRTLPDMDDIWVQPASGDAGGALGAALQVAHAAFGAGRHAGVGRHDAQQGSFLGPEFHAEEIEAVLCSFGLRWQVCADGARHDDRVARALADGLIVGRFDGRMEFGPRALGNRSILADPRRPDGQRHINQRIKFRESWRPFAPMILAEQADEFFDLGRESPYMLLVGHVRDQHRIKVDGSDFRVRGADMTEAIEQIRSIVPAVTHVDYSARIQTIDAGRNPGMHRLLSRFHALTGCPMLVNTSFNVRGEPIVGTPTDAIRCFINSGIDLLAIGPYLALKSEQNDAIRAQEGRIHYDDD
jgi:carbamoyltransferase